MGLEVERKFLLGRRPEQIAGAPSTPIAQGYLALGENEVRLRRAGDVHVLTVKRGAGLSRTEEEVEIPADAFERLWPLTEGRRVEKSRFEVEHAGRRVEVDVYAGELGGLVVAEVEFESADAAAGFEPPDWLGREVTGDARYANQRLALEGPPVS